MLGVTGALFADGKFDAMAQMMTAMAGKGMRERMKMVSQLQTSMAANPEGAMSRKKQGGGKRLSMRNGRSSRSSARKKCASGAARGRVIEGRSRTVNSLLR